MSTPTGNRYTITGIFSLLAMPADVLGRFAARLPESIEGLRAANDLFEKELDANARAQFDAMKGELRDLLGPVIEGLIPEDIRGGGTIDDVPDEVLIEGFKDFLRQRALANGLTWVDDEETGVTVKIRAEQEDGGVKTVAETRFAGDGSVLGEAA